MTHIKLKEFCDQNSITYITGYRWFKAGQIEGAYQTDSGTILIPYEKNIKLEQTNDAMSLFLKKTVEFSKNNSTVEDFAAFVISNFQLKLNGQTENTPRYSKNKPKPEEVQKHFQQFLPDKEKAEQLKAIKNSLKEQGLHNQGSFPAADLSASFTEEPNPFTRVNDPVNNTLDEDLESFKSMASLFAAPLNSSTLQSAPIATEGLVTESVDFNTTPQQINYTGSNNSQTFSSSLLCSTISDDVSNVCTVAPATVSSMLNDGFLVQPTALYMNSTYAPFQPTQKELLSAVQVIETAETELVPRKRGRKPTIKKR